MAAESDRHLLFGLLALQTGLIQQAQLVAAFHAWTCDKSRPLADHLIDLGHLNAAQRAAVEALAALHVEAHGGDVEESLAAVPAGRVDPRGPGRPGRPGHRGHARPGGLPRRDRRGTTPTARPPTPSSRPPDRFRGSASSARMPRGAWVKSPWPSTPSSNREVALKELRPERADDPAAAPASCSRPRSPGRLEHPGVVPVYGLGCDTEGRPFYAMRLVKGETLKEAIERFHNAETGGTNDPRRWNLELRQLLNRFVAVCNVVAYAHSRGVIHRDLKPANILVGPVRRDAGGGLGIGQDRRPRRVGRPAGAVEATLQPASGSGSSETLPGTALGTPAYMSPEQSEGRLEQVGPLSDVYSLGATLYCLLTGKPPIEESDVGEALRRVQRGEFPPPRAVNPQRAPRLWRRSA